MAYKTEVPPREKISHELGQILERAQSERKLAEGIIDLKVSSGCLAELIFTIQYLQLINLEKHPLLHIQNLFELLAVLREVLPGEHSKMEELSEVYYFYRLLLARIRLITGSATDEIDFNASYINALAESMGFENAAKLRDKILEFQKKTRELFTGYIKS